MQAYKRAVSSVLSRSLLLQQRKIGAFRLSSVMGARFQSTIDKGSAEFGAWLENERYGLAHHLRVLPRHLVASAPFDRMDFGCLLPILHSDHALIA